MEHNYPDFQFICTPLPEAFFFFEPVGGDLVLEDDNFESLNMVEWEWCVREAQCWQRSIKQKAHVFSDNVLRVEAAEIKKTPQTASTQNSSIANLLR